MTAAAWTGRIGVPGRLGRTVRDLWLMFREQGAKAPLVDIRDMLRGRLYVASDQLVVLQRLDDAGPPPADPRIRVEAAGARHLPALSEFNRRHCNTRRTHGFQHALATGEQALLGFIGEELIGYFWWMDSRRAAQGYYLSRFGIELGDKEVYGYEFFIAREHRAGGTATEFLARVEAELARLGHERMYGFVECDNVPARWLYTVRGYEVLRRARTRTVLGRLIVVDGTAFLSGRKGLRPLARTGAAAGRG
jgi:GNAT superfamily N-acetyltransferase